MEPPSSPAAFSSDDRGLAGQRLAEPRWTTSDGLLLIRSTNVAGHWTLELGGELDVSNAATLDQEIRLVEPTAASVTIDLGGLEFMDTRAMRTLLDAQQRSRLDGRLHLRRGSMRVQSVFRLTRTEDALPFDS